MHIPWSDLSLIAAILGAILLAAATLDWRRRRRLKFIDTYHWPPGLMRRLGERHPNLSATAIARVDDGLRQYFRAFLRGGCRPVAMPSEVVDDLWHEFILYTREYDRFCEQAFGRKLHHTPAVALAPNRKASNEGLRRVWWQCCREEGIDPRAPASLPLLFALDAELEITGGYRYHPDCEALRDRGTAGAQCGGDFSSVSFDGTTDGLGDGDGSGGDGGGGGCGGD
ncbi:MAG: hypothetical protein NW216_13725 [Hyphomicrobium sp.]|nr:hypothetical protein [Hyphomicrobium sp.]